MTRAEAWALFAAAELARGEHRTHAYHGEPVGLSVGALSDVALAAVVADRLAEEWAKRLPEPVGSST